MLLSDDTNIPFPALKITQMSLLQMQLWDCPLIIKLALKDE